MSDEFKRTFFVYHFCGKLLSFLPLFLYGFKEIYFKRIKKISGFYDIFLKLFTLKTKMKGMEDK